MRCWFNFYVMALVGVPGHEHIKISLYLQWCMEWIGFIDVHSFSVYSYNIIWCNSYHTSIVSLWAGWFEDERIKCVACDCNECTYSQLSRLNAACCTYYFCVCVLLCVHQKMLRLLSFCWFLLEFTALQMLSQKLYKKCNVILGGCVVIERLQQHKQTLLITLTRHKGHSNYCTNFNCLMNIQIKAHLPVTNQTNHIHSLSTGFPFIRNSGKVGADT